MDRRSFISTVAGALLAAPLGAEAQPAEKVYRVGFLATGTFIQTYRTYVITFEIKRGVLPDALYWDTEDPYHYVRLQPGPSKTDYLLVGGEDHKSGEADDADERFSKL